MGSREYGAEQHPDYPPGWTRDAVHREKYGRIQLFTPDQQAERELVKRFTDAISILNRIVNDAPGAEELDRISFKNREMIDFQLTKLGPQAIDRVNGWLRRISTGRVSLVTEKSR